jgi:hypothetical protein
MHLNFSELSLRPGKIVLTLISGLSYALWYSLTYIDIYEQVVRNILFIRGLRIWVLHAQRICIPLGYILKKETGMLTITDDVTVILLLSVLSWPPYDREADIGCEGKTVHVVFKYLSSSPLQKRMHEGLFSR